MLRVTDMVYHMLFLAGKVCKKGYSLSASFDSTKGEHRFSMLLLWRSLSLYIVIYVVLTIHYSFWTLAL
jgi:hypothetical protein